MPALEKQTDSETKLFSLSRLSALLATAALLPLAIRSSAIRNALRSADILKGGRLLSPETTTASLMKRLQEPKIAEWVDRTLAHVGGKEDPALEYLGHGIDAAAFRVKPPGDLVLKLFPGGVSSIAERAMPDIGKFAEMPEFAPLLQREQFPGKPFDLMLQPFAEKLDKLAEASDRRWRIPPLSTIDPEFHGKTTDEIVQWLSRRLAERGMHTYDMHSGNVGFLEGKPVVFDLGSVYSR